MIGQQRSDHGYDFFGGAKQLRLHDYVAIVVRRRWSFMGPFFLVGLLGFVTAQIWPVLYRSEALILVEQQKVPEHYVTPNVSATLQNRLDGITQAILSRTRLQGLIERSNLYPKERARLTMDEVVEQMRRRIGVELVRSPSTPGDPLGFRVSFQADNPQTAQRITNDLTSVFIEQNLKVRGEMTWSTTKFLENQLAEAQKELAVREEALREFKLRYLGELPEQQQQNLQALSSMDAQLRGVLGAVERAEQQKVYLESIRSEYQSLGKASARAEASPPVNPALASVEATLQDLRKQLAALKVRYSAQHPDVVRAREQIAEFEEMKKRLRAEAPEAKVEKPDSVPQQGQLTLIEVEGRLKALQSEIDSNRKQAETLPDQMQQLRARLNLTPLREQALSEIMRAYQNARENHQALLQKKQQSELASNLEMRQQGEKFAILDPASLPVKPDQPNRLQIVALGWAIGLLAGLAWMGFRETWDQSIRREEDIKARTEYAVLVSIPVLRSPREERIRRRRRFMEAAMVTLLVSLSVGTSVQAYLAHLRT